MPLLRGLLPLLLLLTFSWLFLDSVGGGDAYSSVDAGGTADQPSPSMKSAIPPTSPPTGGIPPPLPCKCRECDEDDKEEEVNV